MIASDGREISDLRQSYLLTLMGIQLIMTLLAAVLNQSSYNRPQKHIKLKEAKATKNTSAYCKSSNICQKTGVKLVLNHTWQFHNTAGLYKGLYVEENGGVYGRPRIL